MIKPKSQIIEVSEKFRSVGIKFLDSKNRFVLGDKVKKALLKRMKVDAFEVLIGEEGDVLLRPVANIPSKEAWVHQNPKAMKQIVEGLIQAQHGQVEKVVDLEKFVDDL